MSILPGYISESHLFDGGKGIFAEENKSIYQHTFNRVAEHLVWQAAKSHFLVEEGMRLTCAYRGAEGRCCAVGALIDDSRYEESIENSMVNNDDVLAAIADEYVKDVLFLHYLQRIHDRSAVQFWPRELRAVAQFYGLDMPVWLRDIPYNEAPEGDLGFTRLRLEKFRAEKKWRELGLLDGVAGSMKEGIATLYRSYSYHFMYNDQSDRELEAAIIDHSGPLPWDYKDFTPETLAFIEEFRMNRSNGDK